MDLSLKTVKKKNKQKFHSKWIFFLVCSLDYNPASPLDKPLTAMCLSSSK